VKSFFDVFEFFTTLLLFISCILFLSNDLDIKFTKIFVLMRFFRFFLILLNFHYLRSIFEYFLGCLSLFVNLFSVLFVLNLFFATFGMCFFGGLLNQHIELTYNKNSYSMAYYSSNFNDLPNSFLILFSLMIVNNWNNQVINKKLLIKLLSKIFRWMFIFWFQNPNIIEFFLFCIIFFL